MTARKASLAKLAGTATEETVPGEASVAVATEAEAPVVAATGATETAARLAGGDPAVVVAETAAGDEQGPADEAAKAEALAKFEAEKAAWEDAQAIDLGGTVRARVLFAMWQGTGKDGRHRIAYKGSVVKVTAAVADRGEELGGLERI
jgi:hypothetical protein